MKDYTLEEQYAIISLNGLDSKHNTEAKKVAVTGIAIAKELQKILNKTDNESENDNAEKNSVLFSKELNEIINGSKQMNKKERNAVEEDIAAILKARGVLTEIPNLLGCDMNYYTADITMREYKSDIKEYQTITEALRAMILEPGEIPMETVMLLWLLRESGCIHDIFSVEEQRQIERLQIQLKEKNELFKVLLESEFHSLINQSILKFLKWKSNLFKNPYLEGINLLYPFLDRKQSIFIDMVIFNTTVQDRRQTAIDFLRKNGHTCDEIRIGTECLVKIDNNYYRIWPTSLQVGKIPVQGVRLLPVYK